MNFNSQDLEEFYYIRGRIEDLERQKEEIEILKESKADIQALKYKEVSVQERDTSTEGSKLENDIVAYLDEIKSLETQIMNESLKLVRKINDIKKWIDELPSTVDKQIMEMRVFEQMTYQQIGEKLFMGTVTVYDRYKKVIEAYTE